MRIHNSIWGFIVPIVALLILITLPILVKVNSIAKEAKCRENMKTIFEALNAYSKENEGAYSTKIEWCDLLIQKTSITTTNFCCPIDTKDSFSYAINDNLYKTSIIPDRMVVLFEANLGRNGVGGVKDIALRHKGRHQSGCNIIFADGHAVFITDDQIGSVQWTEGENETGSDIVSDQQKG